MSGPRSDPEDEVARLGGGRVIAIVGVIGLAAAMAAVPVLVASGVWGDVVVGLAGLVAVVGAVKVAAMAWGLAAAVD